MNNNLWIVFWTEYSGYDCSGHRMFNLYNGTYEDALKYGKARNEETFEEVVVREFDAAELNKKGAIL
jgi:hypothetical protein